MNRDNNHKEESADEEEELNELSTAIRYYRLFLEEEPTRVADASQRTTRSCEEEEDSALWHEDQWTEQDTIDAERILMEAEERCNVQRQRSIKKDAASLDWNTFYQQHETNFFKDRHYLQQAFPDEMSAEPGTLVEIGCGVGNALLPLLDKGWTVWGLDFSQVAIDLLQQQDRFMHAKERAHAHVWDISKPLSTRQQDEAGWLGTANVTTLLFCLSALHPNDMVVAARNVAATLQPGGTLLFRDYGRYDEAQLKLGTSRGKRLGPNFYRKHDGTQVYYFTLEDLERLFVEEAGLQVLELEYIRRIYYNRGTGVRRRRVWVQARFRKRLV